VADEDPQHPDDTLPPGKQLGRYQIVRLIGHGGMASVYEGIHLDLKKRVAIKTLHPGVAASAEVRARFLREGEATSRINHPNVVDVTDVGTIDGTTYLVMEFLEGEDLAATIFRTGAMSVTDALDILLPVAGAIAVAHEEGVIHRDLKPGNIFMSRSRHGGIKPTVLDFGISKLSSGGANTMALTGTGAAMGTPYYVAPEQVRSAAGADGRSDQYALGAILYECLTGQRAHQGESIYEVIRSVGEGSFAPPRAYRPDLPPALEQAILRAMELDPARRFPSVQAFGRALLPFASAAAAAHWAPIFGAGDGPASAARPIPGAGAKAGATVIMPTPLPGPAAHTPSGRSRSAPRVSPRAPTNEALMSDSTLGASAGQVTVPNLRRRSGLLAFGVLAVVGGGAAGAYFLFEPKPPTLTRSAPPASDGIAAAASRDRDVEKAPRRYRVDVTVVPDSARVDLDGKSLGVGRVDEELPADGADHTLKVSAPGFLPASFSFRDHPPPGRVTLEPAPNAPPTAASSGHAEAHPAKPAHHEHAGGHPKPHVSPAGKPASPAATDSTPIID
jgi:serine/threonine-protein kinase